MTSPSSSPILPIWKRYRVTSELVEDTKDDSSNSDAKREGPKDKGHGLEDKGHGLEDEVPSLEEEEEDEAAPEGQQEAVPVVDTMANEPLRLAYGALRRHELALGEGSMPILPSSLVVPSPRASPVTTPSTTIAVDKDKFLEVGAQLELHGSILHDHTQHLDALPPVLFEGYDRDFIDLYTRSREVRDEIFSQRYRLRSLEQDRRGLQ
ncbi:hypothetical protein Tco_1020768 [Tanacetum coccineum]